MHTLYKKIASAPNTNLFTKLVMPIALCTTLSACFDGSSSSSEPEEISYQLTITNLTNAQPLSPITAVLHGDNTLWQIGEEATVALEKIAESGDNADFIADENVLAYTAHDAVLPPSNTVTINLMTTDETAHYLTLTTMLVNTNDAFSGLSKLDLSSLTVNTPKTWRLPVYDAGTELNSELAGTIPGPADSGIGYDATRDDTNFISMHQGVVSQDDGLTQSVLSQAHRFDNPAIKLTITRIE